MLTIDFTNEEHVIQWEATQEQKDLIRTYKQPLKRKLAEEQAARYRKDPVKYRYLESVVSLLEEGIYSPYLGTIGGGDRYILHKLEGVQQYAVQYQYLDSPPIWLTSELGVKADGVYRVTPTSLGYIVHYEVDISKYEEW
jgi:hypothetical protein